MLLKLILVILLLLGFCLISWTPSHIEGWRNLKKHKLCLTCTPQRLKQYDTQYFTTNTTEVPLWLKQPCPA